MFVSVIGYKQYLSKTFNNFNNMSKSEVFMFPDSYNNGGNNGSSIDPALLLLLNNNGGFGGGNFMWVIFLFFLYPLLRNGGLFGNGGMFGGGGNGPDCASYVSNLANNQTGRELLAQAIQGNRDAISNLSNMLGCQIGDIQTVLSNIMTKVSDISCQTQLSAQQVINSIQSGNAGLASQLASCCCDLKGAIKDVAIGTERGFASVAFETQRQTCDIEKAIAASTAQIVAGQKDAEMREVTRENAALREKVSDLKFQVSQEHQTAAVAGMINQAVTPLAQELASLKCKLPETVTLPYSCATAVPTNSLYGLGAFGLGWNNPCAGQIWG